MFLSKIQWTIFCYQRFVLADLKWNIIGIKPNQEIKLFSNKHANLSMILKNVFTQEPDAVRLMVTLLISTPLKRCLVYQHRITTEDKKHYFLKHLLFLVYYECDNNRDIWMHVAPPHFYYSSVFGFEKLQQSVTIEILQRSYLSVEHNH